MARTLGHGERVAWLTLARTPRVGALNFQRLLSRFGGAEAALEAAPRLAQGLTPPPRYTAEAELDALKAMGARLLCGRALLPFRADDLCPHRRP